MRIGLLTDGGYPYATGESRLWCDRLVRGLADHEFDVCALSRSARQERAGVVDLPPQVRSVHTAPLWTPAQDGPPYGRRDRRGFAEQFGLLAAGICDESSDSFAVGLHGLADLARERGGLPGALRSETAVRILESACRARGARGGLRGASVADYLAFADHLERTLRPLSLDWYGTDDPDQAADDEERGAWPGLGAVDLCHAASAGAAALPGLLAKRFFGTPLLVTEYGVHLRARYLAAAGSPAGGSGASDTPLSAPLRALLAAFHGRLTAEVYRAAALITPGNRHGRRWQERCGADRAKLRTVHPGMEAGRFADAGESGDPGDPDRIVWVGRIEPAKDLVGLLHAFAEIRRARPATRLRIVGAPVADGEGPAYLAHCRALAEQLFPDEAPGAYAVGENPVSFEEVGGPAAPTLAEAYTSGGVVVLSSVVEGFPISLVEAMFCGRATVSTDVGAVVEVIGGTGLVVPPRNPRSLAEACLALLGDEDRRRRLGAAARSRALELFTVEQNIAAFRSLYLEIVSHTPVSRRPATLGADGGPLPFAVPAEVVVPVRWTGGPRREAVGAAAGTGGGDV